MRIIGAMLLAAALSTTHAHASSAQSATTEDSKIDGRETPPGMWIADFAAMQRLTELGESAKKEERFGDAAVYFARASELSANVPSPAGLFTTVAAAEAYVKTGEHDRALDMLDRAAQAGLHHAEYIASNTELAPLHGNKRFETIVAHMRQNAEAFRESHRRAEDAKLIFDDVKRFWTAYDKASEARGTARKASVFREHYLAPGSPGLIDYHWLKTQSMEQLVQKIEDARGYYDGIRERTLEAGEYESVIRNGLRRFIALYPDGSVPDVTFVIGRLTSGGTAGPSGMLIGLDVWSWQEGVPLDGIDAGFQKAIKSFNLDSLPFIVVHEHIHALQQYASSKTVLEGALAEGSADFLAGLALPEQKKPHYYDWGLEREAMVWRRFQSEIDSEDFENWLGNNGADLEEGWYADLGYFIGARICEAYYDQADDKEQAIRDLLFVTDAKAILEASGYAERF